MHSDFKGLIEIGVLNSQNMTQATWVLGPIRHVTSGQVLRIRDPALFWPLDQVSGSGIWDGKKSESGNYTFSVSNMNQINNCLLDEEEESGIASGAATPGNRVIIFFYSYF